MSVITGSTVYDELAEEYGLGLEIAEYCTAWNMDEHFEEVDVAVRKKIDGKDSLVLHAPFNELFPCAIDKMVREVARVRYRQAFKIAAEYGLLQSGGSDFHKPHHLALSDIAYNPYSHNYIIPYSNLFVY